ncbi:hypothetical protein AMECASPLE_011151 [Ameca splendens]|uniref:Uncharacterized protein n=1 Tax=Ameca splendens TaxID=208324 RepID=A0ABV0ZXS9_9TELE
MCACADGGRICLAGDHVVLCFRIHRNGVGETPAATTVNGSEQNFRLLCCSTMELCNINTPDPHLKVTL